MMQIIAAFFCVSVAFKRYMSDPVAFLHLNLHNPSLNVKGKVQPKLFFVTTRQMFLHFYGEKQPNIF